MAKFKYIGPMRVKYSENGEKIEMPARCMDGNSLKTGDVVELNDYFSAKAELLDTYEKIKPGPKPKDNQSFDQVSLKGASRADGKPAV